MCRWTRCAPWPRAVLFLLHVVGHFPCYLLVKVTSGCWLYIIVNLSKVFCSMRITKNDDWIATWRRVVTVCWKLAFFLLGLGFRWWLLVVLMCLQQTLRNVPVIDGVMQTKVKVSMITMFMLSCWLQIFTWEFFLAIYCVMRRSDSQSVAAKTRQSLGFDSQ